jgi:hypothetical protein
VSLLVDDPSLQQAFVADPTGHGQQIVLTPSYKCPCGSTPDANRSRIDCAICFGIGYFYDFKKSATLDAIISQVHMTKSLIDVGLAEPGDLTMTLPPTAPVFVKDYDLIRLTVGSGEPYEGDVIQRGKLGAIAGNASADLLTWEVVTVERCFSVNPQTQVVVDYINGVDFSINGRLITWQNNLALGTIYSIRYTCLYDWIAYVSPVERFERNISLGQRALLKRRAAVLPASASTLA